MWSGLVMGQAYIHPPSWVPHNCTQENTRKKRKDIVTCNIVVYQSEGEKKKNFRSRQ